MCVIADNRKGMVEKGSLGKNVQKQKESLGKREKLVKVL